MFWQNTCDVLTKHVRCFGYFAFRKLKIRYTWVWQSLLNSLSLLEITEWKWQIQRQRQRQRSSKATSWQMGWVLWWALWWKTTIPKPRTLSEANTTYRLLSIVSPVVSFPFIFALFHSNFNPSFGLSISISLLLLCNLATTHLPLYNNDQIII